MTNHSPQTQVFSIPAADSYIALKTNCVYSCPASYLEFADKYLAFRQKGGEMDAIYSVDSVCTLDPHDETTWRFVASSSRDRIRQYVHDRADYFASNRGKHRFYLLTEAVELPHKPRPERNNVNRRRYTWQELTVGESVIER